MYFRSLKEKKKKRVKEWDATINAKRQLEISSESNKVS